MKIIFQIFSQLDNLKCLICRTLELSNHVLRINQSDQIFHDNNNMVIYLIRFLEYKIPKLFLNRATFLEQSNLANSAGAKIDSINQ